MTTTITHLHHYHSVKCRFCGQAYRQKRKKDVTCDDCGETVRDLQDMLGVLYGEGQEDDDDLPPDNAA
jgi:PHP family Zn ribbon phosphoesterase